MYIGKIGAIIPLLAYSDMEKRKAFSYSLSATHFYIKEQMEFE